MARDRRLVAVAVAVSRQDATVVGTVIAVCAGPSEPEAMMGLLVLPCPSVLWADASA